MPVDLERIRGLERRHYVLDNAPSILCALIMRRASTEPAYLIDLAIETASRLYDKLEPNPNAQAEEAFVTHTNGGSA